MRFVKCVAGGICGDIRVWYLCAVWEPGKITPLLLCICICNCICIVFVLYLWRHRCGVFAGSVGVGTINAPAASPQIPILPSSSPLPSSLPNYLLNCPQHRRLATRALNNALAKFSNLLTVSRSVWPIPFNSFHLPISVIVWFQQMCLKHIFCLKHNQLLSNFWNTTSRFDSQAIGCITRISNRSRSDCFAIGKTWDKFTKWQMIDVQLQLPISAGCYLREASVYENGWIFSYWKGGGHLKRNEKSASASRSTIG